MIDTIVVGTGPAGATAARLLAQKGYRVLLLEKEKLPRHKTCAGGIGHRVWRRIPEVKPLLEEKGVPISRALMVAPDGFSFEADAGEVVVYDILRSTFDKALADLAVEAGAELRERAEVVGVEETGDRVRVVTRGGEAYEARSLVGADGVNSVVSRSLGLMPKNWFSDNAFCPVALYPREDGWDRHEFYFGLSGAGYGWVFPHSDHLNIGIGALRRSYREKPVDTLARFTGAHPLLAPRLKGAAPIRVIGHYIPYNGMLPRLHTGRALLVGDAGGFVNTLTGEGIHMAVKTAELAVKVLSRALDSGFAEGLGAYQALAEKDPEVGEELRIGRLLRDALFKDLGFLSTLIREAAGSEEMARFLLDLIYVRKQYPVLAREASSKMSLRQLLGLVRRAPREVFSLLAGGGTPYFPAEW